MTIKEKPYLIDKLNDKIKDVLKDEFIDLKFIIHYVGNKCNLFIQFNDLPINIKSKYSFDKLRKYLIELIENDDLLIKVITENFKYYLQLKFKKFSKTLD